MSLSAAAQSMVEMLRSRDLHLVLAESCTGGLVSASLAAIPGVSEWLCGSAVTYRDATKVSWLELNSDLIADQSAVSNAVTEAMARNVLERTPEATVAVAVTGHLGPDAPEPLDGVVFIALAWRLPSGTESKTIRKRLTASDRSARQQEATEQVLLEAAGQIERLDLRE